MTEAAVRDLRLGLSKISYSQNYEEERPNYIPTFEIGMEEISNFLGSKIWLMGESITYADFSLYENLCAFHSFEPSCFDKHPNLKQYVERFECLPFDSLSNEMLLCSNPQVLFQDIPYPLLQHLKLQTHPDWIAMNTIPESPQMMRGSHLLFFHYQASCRCVRTSYNDR
uniref:glutathione transferase n=2 Tax=Schistocephalus solidus TaxID=70667 RepID=A0A0X3Q264_SCHSO